jgi:hypothetical protein
MSTSDRRAARARSLYPVQAWLRDGSEIVIRPSAKSINSESAAHKDLMHAK